MSVKYLYVKLSVVWSFALLEKDYYEECSFHLRKQYKITIGQDNMWPEHSQIPFISSHSADACSPAGIRGWSAVARAWLWTRPRAVWCVHPYGGAGPVPIATTEKMHCLIRPDPSREVIFSGRKESAPSVKGLPVLPKFGDEESSSRLGLCFCWQLTRSTSYEPFNSNCLPHVPSSSTP